MSKLFGGSQNDFSGVAEALRKNAEAAKAIPTPEKMPSLPSKVTKRRSIALQRLRGGRQSTILSQTDRLGR